MRKIIVDAVKFTDKREMHSALRAALGEEDYIGSNLDALHDKLTMIFEPTTIVIRNWSYAARHLGGFSNVLWHMLDETSEENPNLTVVIE